MGEYANNIQKKQLTFFSQLVILPFRKTRRKNKGVLNPQGSKRLLFWSLERVLFYERKYNDCGKSLMAHIVGG